MVKILSNVFKAISPQTNTTEPPVQRIVIREAGVGSTGTSSYAGYPSEEYLSQLRGRQRADTFDRMRRSDGQVKAVLKAVKDTVRSASWEVEPGAFKGTEASDEAKADAALVEHILFEDMGKSWDEFISEVLTLLDFGHSVFEVTNKVVFDHPVFGTYNSIRSLGFRSQRTIERWNLDPATDGLKSITQIVNGDLDRYVDIPAEYLIVFTLEKEGSNFEGVSALRACYGPWMRKDLYMKLNAIGVEKFAVPTPIVKIPDGKAEGDQYDNLIAALEAYTSHERNYLTIPQGWDLDMRPSPYDPEKVEVSIDNEDKRMAKAFLANFLELGMNGFGSQSLSVDLSDFFLNSLDHVARIITGEINKTLIPYLIELNRGKRAVYPKLKHSGISDRAGKELSEMLKNLRDSDFIQPSDRDEAHLRKRLNLPAMSSDGVRAKSQPSLPAPATSLSLADRLKAKRASLGQE